MSDLTIPGVSSSIDTKAMIKAIMDVQRVPLEKMKEDVETYEQTKKAWQDLNLKLSRLGGSASALYGFQNPFNERIAKSSDESILSATATREAMEEEKEILVKQTARADKFISGSQDKDFTVDAGTYQFKIGDKEVKFKFNGGSLKDFARIINDKSKNLLKASVINNTKNTNVILIEGIKTGSKNRVEFLDKFKDFAIKAGIIEASQSVSREVNLETARIEQWQTPLNDKAYNIEENRLDLRPESELKLPVAPPFAVSKNMVLEVQVTIEELPEEEAVEATAPPGPKLPDVGDLIFEDIRVMNEKSKIPLPTWAPPEPPAKVEDMQVMFLTKNGKQVALPELNSSQKSDTLKIPIGEYTDRLDALYFRNRNTHKVISFENIKIYDPAARGDYRPVNPLSEAMDAVIEMDGIEIIRETNNIDDLIPGVNLTLNDESDTPVDLAIKQDKELIKDTIINFVGYYNQIITTVDVLARPGDDLLESLDYLTDEEKDDYRENLGILQGEMTLMHLKNNLKNIMMNPYRTSDDNELKLLVQLGISTDSSRPGTGSTVSKTKLRGYLEIDEGKLDEALTRYKSDIKELFGWDSDNDLIVDTGLAYSTDSTLKSYTSLGGILATKNKTLDTRIDRKKNDIDNMKKKLEDYESKLKRDYAMMEGALEQLKQNSESLDNFSSQNK